MHLPTFCDIQTGYCWHRINKWADDNLIKPMRIIDPKARSIGVNFNAAGEAQVLLWAPHADRVEILIPAKDRVVSLSGEGYGYWAVKTTALSPGDLYYFELDGSRQLADPASLSQPGELEGPSQAVDLSSEWTDHDWKNLPLSGYIIYELHTGTFTEEGTFKAIEEKLDYLLNLGITAVEIMPVAQFPGHRNWGYDGVFPFCVQGSYGGVRGLQHLVNACHNKGLAVILDVVFNHVGPQGNHFEDFGPYFTEKYRTPWGNAINFDDAWCDGVRQFYIENALMWLRDFHIDALRMDAVHAIKDFSPVHILEQIRQQVDILAQHTGRKYHLIVELDLNDTRFINPPGKGGFGMNAQWIDEFHHALRVCSGQKKQGYYADFNGVESLAKSYKDAYVYDGTYSNRRKRVFGVKTTDNTGDQFVVFSQNHDQVGNRMLGERTSQLVSFEMQKLLAGAVLVSPYIPLLFMGEEHAERNPFLYFVSHTDAKLADAVREGRKSEFEAFQDEAEAPDPLAEETFINSKVQWNLAGEQPHKTMFDYYKKLIAVRKSQKPLSVLNRKEVSVEYDTEAEVIILHRQYKLQDVICLMNFSRQRQSVQAPVYSPVWHKLIGSSDLQWGGDCDMPDHNYGEFTLILPPQSITLYTNDYE
jgi:maltooligosyltrehalose trehalohydrolase